MRIFLGFGNAQVAEIALTHHVGQDVGHGFGRNDHRQRKFLVVLRHADVVQILGNPVTGDDGVEIGGSGQIGSPFGVQAAVARERAGDLADAVGAEIEADAGIVIADSGHRLAAVIDADKRHDELVGDVFVVGLFYALHRIDVFGRLRRCRKPSR